MDMYSPREGWTASDTVPLHSNGNPVFVYGWRANVLATAYAVQLERFSLNADLDPVEQVA
jgi:hypothetical protein